MKKVIRIIGIMFSVLTVVSCLFFIRNDSDTMRFWLMAASSGTLIFNGWANYLDNMVKRNRLSIGTGVFILILALVQYYR
ncbi:hypothetical protein PSAB_15595 [Paenibacillus sabinae T27]|uniref:Lipoprotein n=1 Tax=Paenibacillus sabinae T27 TaxID=1268072 RepID=X4ZER1_9BACL|nr:hypothetical protein PSAB_15595 [Paenibacillus sabinae T27]